MVSPAENAEGTKGDSGESTEAKDSKKEKTGKEKQASEETRREMARWAVIGLLALVGVFTAIGCIDGAAAWPVVGILLLIGLLSVVPVSTERWQWVRGSVKKIGLGSISAEFVEVVADEGGRAAADDEKAGDDLSTDVIGMQLALEQRLAYVAKHILPPFETPPGATFVTIGSLKFDKFLSEREARIAAGVMTLREGDLATMDDRERDQFVSGANSVIGNLRISVLFGLTKKVLREKGKSTVREIHDPVRPLLKLTVGERKATLVVVFSTKENSNIMQRATKRLKTAVSKGTAEGDLFIVVPDSASDEFVRNGQDGVSIRRVGQLAGEFGLQELPERKQSSDDVA